ncbi:hypothetical protein SKAU_G00368170 [Synaphobranchus kaupii]|uniref:Uncharacterized protein n=1 Tax=Synaphobranchus kaupii TaxID=118154 RepID=A0A9Q1EFI6_SYNKA|nr:hypothetical protein SKAU_G00368170 [Synaphobranchus kaupii]
MKIALLQNQQDAITVVPGAGISSAVSVTALRWGIARRALQGHRVTAAVAACMCSYSPVCTIIKAAGGPCLFDGQARGFVSEWLKGRLEEEGHRTTQSRCDPAPPSHGHPVWGGGGGGDFGLEEGEGFAGLIGGGNASTELFVTRFLPSPPIPRFGEASSAVAATSVGGAIFPVSRRRINSAGGGPGVTAREKECGDPVNKRNDLFPFL